MSIYYSKTSSVHIFASPDSCHLPTVTESSEADGVVHELHEGCNRYFCRSTATSDLVLRPAPCQRPDRFLGQTLQASRPDRRCVNASKPAGVSEPTPEPLTVHQPNRVRVHESRFFPCLNWKNHATYRNKVLRWGTYSRCCQTQCRESSKGDKVARQERNQNTVNGFAPKAQIVLGC